MESVGIIVAFSAGLFSFLSPCVLPLFPSYLSFITGMSVERLSGEVTAGTRGRVLVHSLAFIAGFTAVFVSLGVSVSAAGQFLLDYRDWIRIAGGILIIVFGLYIAGVLRVGLFGRTAQLQIREKRAGLLGSFAVGLTFAIGWTPCVGPILGSILTLASNDKTVAQGTGLLLAYSAGLGIPFLLFSLALGAFLRFFKRYRVFIPVVERVAGVLLIVVGVLVVSNYYIALNAWALTLTPEWLLKRL
ncbi:MAG TPA: cytochrome c biogenesis protein CcdA [Methylomirabilota bacterium]|nr:cytochrome c biogenesis protein CcdA [Methylomirabilota bacterium]